MTNTRVRTVLVVGAATPVGRSVSQALADEGARMLLTDVVGIHLEGVVRGIADRTGSRPESRLLRVTDPDAWSSSVAAVEERWGSLDLVVNAAEYDPGIAWQAATAEDWARSIDINLMGTVHGVAAAVPALRRSAGAFVLVATVSAGSSRPVLASARSGAVAFLQTIRQELTPQVTVVSAIVSEGAEDSSGGRILAEVDAGATSLTVEGPLM